LIRARIAQFQMDWLRNSGANCTMIEDFFGLIRHSRDNLLIFAAARQVLRQLQNDA